MAITCVWACAPAVVAWPGVYRPQNTPALAGGSSHLQAVAGCLPVVWACAHWLACQPATEKKSKQAATCVGLAPCRQSAKQIGRSLARMVCNLWRCSVCMHPHKRTHMAQGMSPTTSLSTHTALPRKAFVSAPLITEGRSAYTLHLLSAVMVEHAARMNQCERRARFDGKGLVCR